jgi:hypothetical protein
MGSNKDFRRMPKVDTTNVGYSDLRLWPCYLILTSLLLLLAPFMGLAASIAVVCVPVYMIASYAAKQERKDIDKYYAEWDEIRAIFTEIAMRDKALEDYNVMPMVDLRSVNNPPKEILDPTSPITKERSIASLA